MFFEVGVKRVDVLLEHGPVAFTLRGVVLMPEGPELVFLAGRVFFEDEGASFEGATPDGGLAAEGQVGGLEVFGEQEQEADLFRLRVDQA